MDTKTESQKRIMRSDTEIKVAKEILESHHRGQVALKELKTFLNKNQQGLDLMSSAAIVTLVHEFFIGHRRGFLP